MALFLSIFLIIIVSTISLGRNEIIKYEKVNPEINVTRIIEESENPLVTIFKLNDELQSEQDYLCNIKTCLTLCCSIGMARQYGECITNNSTVDILSEIQTMIDHVDGKNFHLLFDDPCNFDWMLPSFLIKFRIQETGTIQGINDYEESIYDFRHYCLFWDPQLFQYSAKVCRIWIPKTNWIIAIVCLVILIMIVIFVVYTVIPEQRNLHGLIFRSYIASYIIGGISVLGVEITVESRAYIYLHIFFETTAMFSAGSCALWLNAMSFNVWRSFRDLRIIDDNVRKRDKEKFIGSAVYACGIPIVVIITLLSCIYSLPYLRNEPLGCQVKRWTCVFFLSVVYLSNIFLFTWTALAIRKHKKVTAYLKNGVNKHHDVDEQWFNLFVKLFLLMGGHIVVWIMWLVYLSPWAVIVFTILEPIQAFLVFVFFVLKKNVRQSFCKRFTEFFKL